MFTLSPGENKLAQNVWDEASDHTVGRRFSGLRGSDLSRSGSIHDVGSVMEKWFTYSDWPVNRKITFIVLLTCTVLFMVMALAVTIEKNKSFCSKLEKDSGVLASIIGANSTAALMFKDRQTGYEILTALKAEQDIIQAVIYGRDNAIFASYINPDYTGDSPPLSDVLREEELQFDISLGGLWFDVSQPISLNGKEIGWIVLRTDLMAFNKQRQVFIFFLGSFSLTLLALAMFICARLNRTILEPISNLAGAMQSVTETQNYNISVQKKNDDEIGVLIEGFNTMLTTVGQRDNELAQYREQLEEIVDERTGELKVANQKLRHEIEEREEVQRKLAHAQKMEAIGTLAGGVAHDLNNILSGVVSYPDLLLAQIPEDSALKEPMKTIRNSGKKAAAIVQDLLTLARRGVKSEEKVELGSIITEYLQSPEAVELFKNHQGVRVLFDSGNEQYPMLGSPVHLSKTIMNLVSNAAEAIPEEGQITIDLARVFLDEQPVDYEQWRKGYYIKLTIADTGTGIAERHLERIFEPFFSRKVMGKSGTGLGTAVVWGAVEDHKGNITVESVEGEGTTFRLLFPMCEDGGVMPAPRKKETGAVNGNGQKILVVDDSEQQRRIAVDILSHLGYDATSVSSGEEAVDYLQTEIADLVLLDMLMDPGISGLETYKKILEFKPEQKAIIASGYSKKEPINDALALGLADYVVKPYSVQRLGSAIGNVLS